MKWYEIILMFLIIITAVIYVAIILEMYFRSQFIFKPYNPPNNNIPTFQPLGTVTPLTEEEKIIKNNIIFCNLYPDDCQENSS